MANKIFIGIDAGQKTGVAVWDRKQFVSIETTDFWGAIGVIAGWLDSDNDIIVVVEDPSQNKPVFKIVAVYGFTKGNHQSKLAAAAKVAQSVGGVKRESELIIEYCIQNNIKVIPVKPTKKSMTKLSKEAFEKITGYSGRTSEHGRDSAMLIYQR